MVKVQTYRIGADGNETLHKKEIRRGCLGVLEFLNAGWPIDLVRSVGSSVRPLQSLCSQLTPFRKSTLRFFLGEE